MTTHIEATFIEDRLAIGTLALEGYQPIAEHLRSRLEIADSLPECVQFTCDFRRLMTPAPAQAP